MPLLKSNDRATRFLVVLTAVGIAVLALRLLIATDRFNSALLYVGLPFGLSLALYYLTPETDGATWLKRFWNNLRLTLIVLFGSSLILMEGYLCVILFLPIFVFIVMLTFVGCYLQNRSKRGSAVSFTLPALILLLSLEGTSDLTTLNRYNEVSHSQVIEADAASIKERLSRPIAFESDRHWSLSVFPMPRHVGTVALDKGQVRAYDFVYHRWFVANTHRGRIEVTFTDVGAERIVTSIEDDSYISGYLKLHGTELHLAPLDDRRTRVTLTVKFERLLDPIWYFEPLQRFVVAKGAAYFVSEILGAGPRKTDRETKTEA